MLAQQRKQHLLGLLEADGRIVAKEAARALGTSEDTIRRDLRTLAGEGLLQRVHGGALPASMAVKNLKARGGISIDEKRAIGLAAARLVEPGQVIFIDGGTTTTQLVRNLSPTLHATVVTHSPTIAVELVDHAVDVQLIGGRLFKHSMVSVGSEAIDAIRRVRADNYFMGVTGVHSETGLTTGDAEEAKIKCAMAECSADVTVLVSPEKLGSASPFIIGDCSLMTTMVVLDTVPKCQIEEFKTRGIDVVLAKAN